MRTLTFGGGTVHVDDDGTPVAFAHPQAPWRRYLLDPVLDPWHGAGHAWGSGWVTTDAGTGRWARPTGTTWHGAAATSLHHPLPRLRLTVHREVDGPHLIERYTWTCTGPGPVRITGLAVDVPVRDVYDLAGTALRRSCHAHVFTGGAWAWVLAAPMDGLDPLLGVVVTEGELWAYSVESRNAATGSNVRGHLMVHPTDQARNPGAFGGQPVITLAPGASWTLAWRIGWYPDQDAFVRATDAPVEVPHPVGPVGRAHDVVPARGAVVVTAPAPDAGHGVHVLEVERHGRRGRTAVARVAPLRELVEARVARVLRQHRPAERAGERRHAFVPVDTRTGLRTSGDGWPDWSDGAERMGMAVLLQQARRRGWGDGAAIDEALAGYVRFARSHLVAPDGSVRRSSTPGPEPLRLYNTPWLAHLLVDHAGAGGGPDDLDLAVHLLERAEALGGGTHLSIGHAEAVTAAGAALLARGDTDRAGALQAGLVRQAHAFARLGPDLPAHEVHYEQSMVAPLVTLLATAHALEPHDRLLAALRPAVRWLRAFGGPQPHARLHQVPIRHWDGYWFGLERLWGDVFPHHWSVLTATALLQLPAPLLDDGCRRVAHAVFAANLVDFTPQGGATCAFVMPSCVDGRPAHRADPLANDQDWALALMLRAGWDGV